MSRPAEIPAAAIRQAAAEWLVRHDRGLTATERRDFALWCAANPRHAETYAEICDTWHRLDRTVALRHLVEETEMMVQRMSRRRQRGFRLVVGAFLAAAAAAAVFVAVSLPRTRPAPSVLPSYEVQASTARTVRLSDGSTVMLNGDSRILTSYTATERRVTLLQGEAHFIVAKNPQRPFFVTAGRVMVRAVGTAFNVQLKPSSVQVLVTEGKVRMSDSASGTSLLSRATEAGSSPATAESEGLLVAGQRAEVRIAGEQAQALVKPVDQGEIEQALAWQTTRLVFNDTPLDEVAAAFNLHNPRRLVLETPQLRAHRITGVFKADNLDGFVRLLEAGADLSVRPRAPDEIVVEIRR